MTPERWRQVSDVCGAVLDHAPEEREAVLAQLCAGDDELKREVEELLDQASSGGSILSRPIWELKADLSLIGQQLSHYKITEKIGSGGMGEVYRAHDNRLGRDVAIKISSGEFSDRFEREARLVAALNHPNICTLHDVGPNYLVMELVEGPTLAERIGQGAIPLQESVQIAEQIVAALDAAHEKGIVHRDLKPSNIKLTLDGVVKVLDFGLAKLAASPTAISSEEATSVAATKTESGVILGTARYMAPEQARGKTVDKRVDIWAFGAVLYEMLAGQPAFEGETISDTMAAVLQQEPDWNRVPTPVRRLLQRCLEKDPKRRLRDIGDIQWELENLGPTADEQVTTVKTRLPLSRMSIMGAVVLLAVVTGLIVWWAKPSPLKQVRRFELSDINAPFVALSPDGSRASYVADGHLYVRAFDSLQAQDLVAVPSGLSAGISGFGIFWSPDGQTIAFATQGAIRRIPAGGGPAIVICKIPASGRILGAAWLTDGTIVFSVWRDGLYKVQATGGTAALYLPVDAAKEVDFHEVSALPDNRLILSTHLRGDVGQPEIFDGKQRRILTTDRSIFRMTYVPPGYLMFVSEDADGGLWALPFGEAPLDFNKAVLVEPGAEAFQAANDGTILVAGPPVAAKTELVWVDRGGSVSSVPGGPVDLARFPQLSPDGRRAAFVAGAEPPSDIFVRDLSGGLDTRLTFNLNRTATPCWFPSGDRLLYTMRSGVEASKIYALSIDGLGNSRELAAGEFGRVSPDGKYLLFLIDARGRTRIRYAPILPDGTLGPARPIFHTDDEPTVKAFDVSPEGGLLAYTLDSSGDQVDIFLTQFPGGTGRWQVASGASPNTPRFSHDGRELFYFSRPQLMAVPITSNPSVKVGRAAALFDVNARERAGLSARAGFDVSPDGRHFLMSRLASPDNGRRRLILIQNSLATLKVSGF